MISSRRNLYLEIRHPTNEPGQSVFAIHLADPRAGVWETNLAIALESLMGIHPQPLANGLHGWSLTKHHVPNFIEFRRVGEWALVGAGQDRNDLLGEIAGRIERDHAPSAPGATNYWLQAAFDPVRAFGALRPAAAVPNDLPVIALTITGDGAKVLTHATLDFPKPLNLPREPWSIPTNLVRGRLASFSAMRGVQSLLSSSPWWSTPKNGPPPDQWSAWTADGSPLQVYLAAHFADASNTVSRLTDVLLRDGNAWLSAHAIGSFQAAPDGNGAVYTGAPLVTPFVKLEPENNVVYAGLLAQSTPSTNGNIVPELVRELAARTNVVALDWELAGPRMESCLYLTQVLRIFCRHPQLVMNSPAAVWLNSLSPRLDKSLTWVSQTAANQLTVERQSTVGLTSLELNLLAGWLESPEFPRDFDQLP